MPVRPAVLVMAYGTPRDLDDIEPYYTDIRRGKPPPRELLDELIDRYRAIGGHSPLYEITSAQQQGLEARLDGVKTYLGQKHQTPFIADGVRAAVADGAGAIIGLVLAPHYSAMSIGDYARRAEAAAEEIGFTGQVEVIRSWHLEPAYVSWLSARVKEALASLPDEARSSAAVIFSAHSLPRRILASGDPYPDQLEETAAAVAAAAGLTRWTIGWQSAGRTAEPWIGPDLLEVIGELSATGTKGAVVCPCGFVADHLEVLYDVDIEARNLAEGVGMTLVRTRSPNDDPAFLDMLAGVVQRFLNRIA
jgi:protoporphyrin/coproporphyrin ferrochelatase